jgi:hypothetical protein
MDKDLSDKIRELQRAAKKPKTEKKPAKEKEPAKKK